MAELEAWPSHHLESVLVDGQQALSQKMLDFRVILKSRYSTASQNDLRAQKATKDVLAQEP
jgi:hypothetical protein